ncbi:tol-pal system protein YbgF [Variovorax ginsengisoli]|uniref:Cell division coordinator CpoB n=1 Tax=Variovorax ginsengisoli TaxID=363844 RepID=A0ABT8S5T6_9BURK|nr:tol-pal system protein YbgF [Variovorax ginsengisoli]MDN8614935.1 tol-pal system protein YbgF [Variovorax ginsengisoli]MDO1534105.1 tol-pal system protein YbgF [Variovorax ginsengisoli]
MSRSSTPSALGISSGFAGLGPAPLTVLGVVFWALSGSDFRRRVGAALMGAGVACSMGCTVGHGLYALSAASAIELRQRVSSSQQRVADDLRKANEDNVQLRRSMLDLSNQMEELRKEVANVRGQNEGLAHGMADMQRGQTGTEQSAGERNVASTMVLVDGQRFVVGPAEKHAFEAALATLREGDIAQAQDGLVAFVKHYPQSRYKPSALFWLGSVQYALHNYLDAEVNFRALVTAEPSHLRAPDALLSVADCQVELMNVKAARRTLQDVVDAYPESEAADVAEERLAKLQ